MRTKHKGSLTVEAVIAFTTFLGVSFILLHLVKLVTLTMVLDNAAAETAKQIATAAYPIGMFNAVQGKMESQAAENAPVSVEDGCKRVLGDTLESLFSGKGAQNSLNAGLSAAQRMLEGEAMQQLVLPALQSLKSQAGHALAARIIEQYIDNSGLKLDKSKLVLSVVKLPQTDMEFAAKPALQLKNADGGIAMELKAAGQNGDGAYNADDVVICAEYPYRIALPLVPALEITIRSIAVEHAWLKGGGTITVRKEGLDKAMIFGSNSVYIATGGYGKCFHASGACRTLYQGAISEMNRDAAVSAGYRACKICNP